MTVQEKPEIIMEKPVPLNASFVGFKIEREDWNEYRIADNTILKTRFVLLGVLMDKTIDEIRDVLKRLPTDQALKMGFGFRSQTLFSMESPPNRRGSPESKRYSVPELRDSVVEEDIDFETVKSTWNSYLLENGMRLKIRLSPTLVSRTSKFDDAGIPIYVIDSTLDIKVTMPEDIEKILKQRRKVQ
jgi:hypothetical protein